jgi:hypothetical protein
MEISIVTPCFNSIRWIELCVRSVRHALQGHIYEHIVCDGGSTDGTLEFLRQQNDIRLIPGPDKGMYDALNKGMATARGRFLGHLNADEQYDRAGLAHALQKLEQSKADAVFGPTIMLDEHLNFLYLFNQITPPAQSTPITRCPYKPAPCFIVAMYGNGKLFRQNSAWPAIMSGFAAILKKDGNLPHPACPSAYSFGIRISWRLGTSAENGKTPLPT